MVFLVWLNLYPWIFCAAPVSGAKYDLENHRFLIEEQVQYLKIKRVAPRLLVLLGLMPETARAQTAIRLDIADARTLRRHPRLRQSDREIEEQRALKRGPFAPANPDFLFSALTGARWAPGVVRAL